MSSGASLGIIWWRPFQYVILLKEINQFSSQIQWLGGRNSEPRRHKAVNVSGKLYPSIMKCFIISIVVSVTFVSCGPKQDKLQDDNLSKKKYAHIDKQEIKKIELLIADSSIIDPVHKTLPSLREIGVGLSFIDSTGKALFKPTQKIIFTDSGKNNLIDIFNGYLDIPQDTTIATACVILYRHVFILYDSTGKIKEQIYLCLDCTKFDFIKRNAFIKFLDQNKLLFDKLIKTLRKSGAYVPSYGSAANVAD